MFKAGPLFVIFSLFLWGCAGAPKEEGPPAAAADPAPPVTEPRVKTAEEQRKEEVARQISRDLSELKARGGDILLGLDRSQLAAFLGTPQFVRRDDPAVVWLYQGTSCFLDVFFYSTDKWRKNMRDFVNQKQENGATATYRVTYYNVRSQKNEKITAIQCLSGLMKSRA